MTMDDDRLLYEYRREPDPRFARELRDRLGRAEQPRGIPRPMVPLLVTACALGVVVAIFAVPSVRVSAQALLDLFRVRRFAAVEFDEARLEALKSIDKDRGLLVFDKEETLHDSGPPRYVPTRDAASPEAGFAVSTPSYLPDGLIPDSIFVEGEESMRFTVSEAKLRTILDRLDVRDVSVPTGLDGQWIEVRQPPVVVQKFRSDKRRAVLVQSKSPEVAIPPGWNVEQLGEIGLRVLGLDAAEARRIARATDWRTTLLVPVPLNVTTFRQVTVGGNSGLLITTTGEATADGKPKRRGAMLMWAQGDRLFCLQGDLSAEDTIQMAESIPS
jgi:hypothetical protein